ncbi:response regulator transcription factor [Bombiscardovia coagulans]|uniref:Transcriptional regulator n=1 Tax=Bombiscardovia coagulans TaxID=686666 RepID=A0A261EPJ3_9BIFI|nr:response regulator transcription factor [Bombiscardovia coagulans]OZG48771.1 transcriptional regulator [Bombiscardovia coagulans]
MRILIVEDDDDLSAVLEDALKHEGYRVSLATNGLQALNRLADETFDLVLLDRDLPVLSGDEVMRSIEQLGLSIRVLMLTAAGQVEDRVSGLDLGADDYLPKPFAYPELLARIRALQRREAIDSRTLLTRGRLSLDTARRLAYCDGKPLNVAPKEYQILEELLRADGGFVRTEELLERLWDSNMSGQTEVVRTAVYALRKKLPDAQILVSSRGGGYRIP